MSALRKAVDDPKLGLSINTKVFIKYDHIKAVEIPREVVSRLNDYMPNGLICVGSYRREKPVLKDVDYLYFGDLDTAIADIKTLGKTLGHYTVLDVYAQGERLAHLMIKLNFAPYYVLKLDLFRSDKKSEPFALLHHTGSKNFNIRVRAHAKKRGYLLNQYGLKRLVDGTMVDGLTTERDVLEYLGITYKAPRERNE